uniref:uracil-DNA glycosylase family protein n=1 Tax=Pararhizobium sp. IMCC3301 TaxID=3067904 RepID=UPI0027407F46|nr:uracil-DNA glycosylase family protein [Pararhizobium sp. IMCC3301]
MTTAPLHSLVKDIRSCRICIERPLRNPLPHTPKPVLQVSATARICICGQAPGTRVHKSGQPFTDRSGDRLRDWLGLEATDFYDSSKVAIVPMGFCFPGQNASGSDLPPRPECRASWHDQLFAEMPQIEILLAIGQYAIAYHLGLRRKASLTETVSAWREYWYDTERDNAAPRIMPLPHPSWRNNAWLKRNIWFEQELLPVLRQEVTRLTGEADLLP